MHRQKMKKAIYKYIYLYLQYIDLNMNQRIITIIYLYVHNKFELKFFEMIHHILLLPQLQFK